MEDIPIISTSERDAKAISLRMPTKLHAHLTKMAKDNGVPLNTLIVSVAAHYSQWTQEHTTIKLPQKRGR